MKSLFLISDESDNFEVSIKKIEDMIQEGMKLTVISMSILASLELKKRKIKYRTPNSYFNLDINTNKLNDLALKFAKEWYKPYEKEITYKGISLGEMSIYDFYLLFVDALRSVEIAKKIIGDESPDTIYLPQNLKLNEPSFICYETLPKALECLVGKSTPIKKLKGEKFSENYFYPRIEKSLFGFLFRLINFYQKYIFSFIQNNNDLIQFLAVYSYNSLSKNLKERGFSSYKVYPIRIKNRNTKKAVHNYQVLFDIIKKNNYSNLKLEFKNLNLSILLDHRFEETFKSKFTQLVENIEWVEQMIDNSSPKILITMEDLTPIKRAICKSFKNHNIPSLVIQHGMVTKDMGGFAVMPLEARKQAVWGESSYKWHLKRGNEFQKVTGNPSFDQLYNSKFNKETICNKLGLDPNKKIVLVTSGRFAGIEMQYTVEAEEQLIRDTFRSLKDFKYVQKVVKLHPAYQEKYRKIVSQIAKEEDINVLILNDSLWDLIAICDILITFTSTTGLEAILLDKPVLIVDTVYKEDLLGYVSGGAVVSVYNTNDIAPAINEILFNKYLIKNLSKDLRNFVYENAYLNDGKASERVVDLIVDELNNK